MKKLISLSILVSFVLVSCASNETPSPTPTLTSTVLPTETSIPTSTPLPTATYTATFVPMKSPTITPTPSSTLSPEQYPKLADVALKYEDFGKDELSYLISDTVTITDITESLSAQFDCSIDCHGDLWAISGFSVSIMLIRTKSNKDAYNLSKDLCLQIGKNPIAINAAGFEIVNYDDCIRAVVGAFISDPSPNTWVLPISRKEAVLGSTVGSIFIFIRVYHAHPGDDFGGAFFFPLTQFHLYQTKKLIKAGFPANP